MLSTRRRRSSPNFSERPPGEEVILRGARQPVANRACAQSKKKRIPDDGKGRSPTLLKLSRHLPKKSSLDWGKNESVLWTPRKIEYPRFGVVRSKENLSRKVKYTILRFGSGCVRSAASAGNWRSNAIGKFKSAELLRRPRERSKKNGFIDYRFHSWSTLLPAGSFDYRHTKTSFYRFLIARSASIRKTPTRCRNEKGFDRFGDSSRSVNPNGSSVGIAGSRLLAMNWGLLHPPTVRPSSSRVLGSTFGLIKIG